MKYKYKFIFISLILFLACGCATLYNPATERNEFIFINTKQEVSLGKYVSDQIEMEYKFSDDKDTRQRVEEIGQKVAMVADRKDLDYHFNVIEDKELNAFAIPGGYVYVNSGLVKAATDSELACVLGHEIGHIAARHPAKKLESGLSYEIVMGLLLGRYVQAEAIRGINIIFNLIALGYSRNDEKLADRLGVRYTWRAGYDPNGMISFLKRLQKEVQNRGPQLNIEFLKSHPNLEERIKLIEEEINSLKNIQSWEDNVSSSINHSDTRVAEETKVNLSDNKNLSNNFSLRIKQCPVCNKKFSPLYNFCPNDGTRLISK